MMRFLFLTPFFLVDGIAVWFTSLIPDSAAAFLRLLGIFVFAGLAGFWLLLEWLERDSDSSSCSCPATFVPTPAQLEAYKKADAAWNYGPNSEIFYSAPASAIPARKSMKETRKFTRRIEPAYELATPEMGK